MKRVMDDAVSPAVLSEEFGISVTIIREWVKKRGHKLPSKYKVTSSNGAKKNAVVNAPQQNMGGVANQG